MKKDELKKAFDKEFINISVSNELKEKTLENIKTAYIKKNSHLPYLKNFAAIFVVTMLCISIYFTRNMPKINNLESNNEQSILDTIENTEESITSFGNEKKELLLRKSSPQKDSTSINSQILPSTGAIKEEALFMAPANLESQNYGILNDCSLSTPSEAQEISSITSEEDFLMIYPNAEKLENGYKIYENDKEILYVFENGFLKNTIILK